MQIRPARPGDGGGVARVQVETWRTTYTGIMPADVLERLDVRKGAERFESTIMKGDPGQFLLVADAPGSGIVGFAAGGTPIHPVAGYAGEIYAIYILKEFQGRGLGRRLMSAGASRLLEMGLTSMLVWVLAENRPACAAYSALGGSPVESKIEREGVTDLEELCYAWSDIQALASGGRGE